MTIIDKENSARAVLLAEFLFSVGDMCGIVWVSDLRGFGSRAGLYLSM